MFRTLIYPSSGACDCVTELPHLSSCSQFVVCWSFCAVSFGWCSFCRLQPAKWTPPKTSCTKAPTYNELTRPIQQHSRKLLMMAILMSETCWAHKKWNKITSDIKLVFHSSTILSSLYYERLSVHQQEDVYMQLYGNLSCIYISSLVAIRMLSIFIKYIRCDILSNTSWQRRALHCVFLHLICAVCIDLRFVTG